MFIIGQRNTDEGSAGMTYEKIQNLMIAAELARFNARTGVIEQLTGLASSTVRQLIRDITGCKPISGQLPYSTVWYEGKPERLIHCAMFLRLFAQARLDGTRLPGRVFLNAYTHYTDMMSLAGSAWQNYQLSVSRAHLAIQLLRIGELSYRSCKSCGIRYIEARGMLANTCQICRKQNSNAPTEDCAWLPASTVSHAF